MIGSPIATKSDWGPLDADEIAHLTGVTSPCASDLRLTLGKYIFKLAQTEDEFDQIHRLNYRTFVEEVGQYPDTGGEILVDKFHDKNRYFVAVFNGEVVGMIAVHDQPPFSVASRLEDLRSLRALGPRILEARLFAIEPGSRHSMVLRGLLYLMYEYANARGYSHLVISGIESRTRLYERLGFRPLGPAVPQGEASFVPMAVPVGDMPEHIRINVNRVRRRVMETVAQSPHPPVSMLPGPVQLSDEIRRAVSERPVSHRGTRFIERFEHVRQILSDMSGGLEAAIMVGSGTLANEVVAATLAADRSLKRGLVLINGEFGRRLANQATRWGLDFDALEWEWGEGWDFDQIESRLQQSPEIDWIWATHLETSTARMNNIARLFDLAEPRSARVCLDCVSSLGAAETNLTRAHLATGVSGKSIGAFAGLAFILAHRGALDHVDRSRVPTYLDLHDALHTVGPRFTVSSPLVNAMDCAISRFATAEQRAERYRLNAEMGHYVRRRLRALGIAPLVEGPEAAPVITTFRPPDGMTSQEFYDLCLSWGFELSGQSGYLLERGLLQIATMGEVTKRDCAQLFARLRLWMMRTREKSPAPTAATAAI